MQNIEISLYERGSHKLNKIWSPFMSRAADALKKMNWFSGQGVATCLTKIETCLIRGAAAGLETIHISFTKEAATASIPNDILFMKEAAATMEKYIHALRKKRPLPQPKYTFPFSETWLLDKKIHTFFTKEAAAASILNDTLFMREVAAKLENIHTCFEKEAATASTKIHIPFLRDAAAGLKNTYILYQRGGCCLNTR
jgi:hypothetical protein